MYFKSFREDMTGASDYQFEVGKVYTDDPGKQGFHYAADVYAALEWGHLGRVCVVEPLGRVNTFRFQGRYRDMPYYTTDKIWIMRELSYDEIVKELLDEGAPLHMMLKIRAPFEALLKYKSAIRGYDCFSKIRKLDYLTDGQKKALLPKCWHKYIGAESGQ